MSIGKKLVTRKEMEKNAQKFTPISVSVKILEEKFPWLRDITWNGHDDYEKE